MVHLCGEGKQEEAAVSDSHDSSFVGKVDGGTITSSDWDSDIMTDGPAESRR